MTYEQRQTPDNAATWTARRNFDIENTKKRIAEAGERVFELRNLPFEGNTGFRDFKSEIKNRFDNAFKFQLTEVEFNVSAGEIANAPEELQMMFRELEWTPQEADIKLTISGTRPEDRKPHGQFYPPSFGIMIVPKDRQTGAGVWYNTHGQMDVFKPGKTYNDRQVVEWNSNPNKFHQTFQLLREGVVESTYDIGTHAATTGYNHMPHPYVADILEATSHWIVGLVNNRFEPQQ